MTQAASVHCRANGGIAPPGPATDRERDAAMQRSYPVARMLDGGAGPDDAAQLHAWVADGLDWIEGSLVLARNARRHAVQILDDDGGTWAAAERLVESAACFRFAQAAMDTDDETKLQCYTQHSQTFAWAMALATGRNEPLHVPFAGKHLPAWLMLPDAAAAATPAPCVVVFGGADGWCEALYPTVASMRRRGLAVCLVELPGQGLARLRHAAYLDAGFTGFMSRVLDVLAARGDIAPGFGVCGHSLGGSFAVVAAAADSRVVACCSNSGSAWPGVGFKIYPHIWVHL